MDMKICDECQDRSCKLCRKREVSRLSWHKNKEKHAAYRKLYYENNKEVCYQRSRESASKKTEQYRQVRLRNYRRVHGLPLDMPSTKRKSGEGTIDNNGYLTITKRGHPNQMDSKGRIREHVFIMSEYLGRALAKNESVHHKNGDKLDNSIENLELWHKGQPGGQRVKDKIDWAIAFLTEYGYKVAKE
jgi:hypothetical protein